MPQIGFHVPDGPEINLEQAMPDELTTAARYCNGCGKELGVLICTTGWGAYHEKCLPSEPLARIPASITADAVPEPWELEAAAIFMDHVDDDETESVHRVAAFLRRVAAHPLPQGEAGPAAARLADIIKTRLLGVPSDEQDVCLEDADWQIILNALAAHPLGDAGDTKPGDHERGCQGREYTCTCGYDDKRDALLSSLRAERDDARADALHFKDHAEAAESSLAAEKQRVEKLHVEFQALTDTHNLHMEILQRCANARHAAEQRVAALEGALKPFAERCDEAVHPEDHDTSGLVVKVGFLRAARAVFLAHP